MEKKYFLYGLLMVLVVYQILIFFPINLKTTTFEVKDSCGKPFNNVILHSIPEESICKAECYNRCGLLEKEFVKVKFEKSATSCHSCMCTCR